jgi:hypothetical protein
MMGERCGMSSSILLMALDVVIQVIECLDTWQVCYGNLNLEGVLNNSNQVNETQAIQLQCVVDNSVGSDNLLLYLKFL